VKPDFLMFFDVESIGLHGEGFAVGWVVVDAAGELQEEQRWACPSEAATGEASDRDWVAANVPALAVTHDSPIALRAAFWAVWQVWRERGACLVADCPWPVEAGFLSACVKDLGPSSHWQGPYPLLDVSTLVWAAGHDPRQPNERVAEAERPIHDPLADSHHALHRWQESCRALHGATSMTARASSTD
jgi:hypothetical protein